MVFQRLDIQHFASQIKKLIQAAAVLLPVCWGTVAQANCADSVGRLEYFQPAMERRWSRLQQQQTYPWGQTNLFQSLNGSKIVLAQSFSQLTGEQKNQVISSLGINDVKPTLFDDLTPEERDQPGIGALSPYNVFLEDGRLLFTAYDGCTPIQLLTERDRFSYYHTRRPRQSGRSASVSDLRNAGRPFWRTIKTPVGQASERQARLNFWQTVGYEKAQEGWWFAWVPETGKFEIAINSREERSLLNTFLATAPKYQYQIVLRDGTRIN